MSETRARALQSSTDAASTVGPAQLPDAPLAMPLQSLEPPSPIGILRAVFGTPGRAVKQ
jgi:hypothetical protein